MINCSSKVVRYVWLTLCVAVAFVLHSISARLYYAFTYKTLEIAAALAVRTGADYLPANCRAAMQAADASAQRIGIKREEIVFTGVSSDNQTLTIRLSRNMPRYLTVLVVGLPGRKNLGGCLRASIAAPESSERGGDH
jgi:hypothetical protein